MNKTDLEIRRAYYEDTMHPYYSIQDGQRQRARGRLRDARPAPARGQAGLPRPGRGGKSPQRWTWGHFRAALLAALRHERGQAA